MYFLLLIQYVFSCVICLHKSLKLIYVSTLNSPIQLLQKQSKEDFYFVQVYILRSSSIILCVAHNIFWVCKHFQILNKHVDKNNYEFNKSMIP